MEKEKTLRKEKIREATKGMCEMFDTLELTLEERAIVTKSGYAAAKRCEALQKLKREVDTETEEKPQKLSKIKILTAVLLTGAVVISTISIFATLLK